MNSSSIKSKFQKFPKIMKKVVQQHYHTLSNEKCENFVTCLLEPMLITFGIIFNLTFLVICFKNRRKPTSHFLLLMVICDIVSLVSLLTAFINTLIDVPDLSSRVKMCQLSSYLTNYFAVLNICLMIAINFILISLIKLKTSVLGNVFGQERQQESFAYQRSSNMRRKLSEKLKTSSTLIQCISKSQFNITSLINQKIFFLTFLPFLGL